MDPSEMTEKELEEHLNLCPGCGGLFFSGASLFPEHANALCPWRREGFDWVLVGKQPE